MTSALVIHSPLVGPATVRPLAGALEARRWSTVVPDLRASLASPEEFARDAAAAGHCDVVIGHSGAGPLLPIVAGHVGARAIVFVDAVVPGRDDVFAPSAEFFELIDALPVEDGVLPPWHQWWPAGTLERLVPDDALRASIVAEVPRVSRAFYDSAIALPPEWWTGSLAYLQLSRAYDDDRARATAWGWPTAVLDGTHLDPATRPDAVADAVVGLVARLV